MTATIANRKLTSQLPVDQAHAYLGGRTLVEAILDRLVHSRYELVQNGQSTAKRPECDEAARIFRKQML